eukprot:GHUV01042057.1.p1 GENE.GHUV01042057.1~~GHUV01042057.1.p1  ORF type:complete len:161 (+),score=38.54 GHUV01042057.1:14-496(+)
MRQESHPQDMWPLRQQRQQQTHSTPIVARQRTLMLVEVATMQMLLSCSHTVIVPALQLLSSLIDSAERFRQFSPVKESFSTAVLEEVRWRLFRIIAGDGFSEDVGVRRRALDIIFQALQREQQEQQKSLARQQQLATASNAGGRSVGSDLKNLSPSKGGC